MRKVLIISALYFDYEKSVARAFEAFGFETHIETYDLPIHPFHGWSRWKYKFAHDKEALKEQSRHRYKPYIEKIFDDYSPDIVFIYNGSMLQDDTLDYFRSRGAKVIVWAYDSVLTPDRVVCKKHIDHVDLFCCFEQTDVTYFTKHGKEAAFLPLACDTTVYYPRQVEKDIDILFVGNINTSAKRKHILEQLVKHYPNLNIQIYGKYRPRYKDLIAGIFEKNRKTFLNHHISPYRVNELYARSKIALNIHHEQSLNGANQRFFEASGAGTYQICDTNPYISSVFPNDEIGLYNNLQELFQRIDYALTHDMSSNAKAAYQIVVTQHTFTNRIEQMLNWLK